MGISAWLGLWHSIVILHDLSVFCTDQMEELKGAVRTATPASLKSLMVALISVTPSGSAVGFGWFLQGWGWSLRPPAHTKQTFSQLIFSSSPQNLCYTHTCIDTCIYSVPSETLLWYREFCFYLRGVFVFPVLSKFVRTCQLPYLDSKTKRGIKISRIHFYIFTEW